MSLNLLKHFADVVFEEPQGNIEHSPEPEATWGSTIFIMYQPKSSYHVWTVTFNLRKCYVCTAVLTLMHLCVHMHMYVMLCILVCVCILECSGLYPV